MEGDAAVARERLGGSTPLMEGAAVVDSTFRETGVATEGLFACRKNSKCCKSRIGWLNPAHGGGAMGEGLLEGAARVWEQTRVGGSGLLGTGSTPLMEGAAKGEDVDAADRLTGTRSVPQCQTVPCQVT